MGWKLGVVSLIKIHVEATCIFTGDGVQERLSVADQI